MQQTYFISGMTCKGCKSTVTNLLQQIDGVQTVDVRLETNTANITSNSKISFSAVEKALENSHYQVHKTKPKQEETKQPKQANAHDVFYCPMRCEGDKEYEQPGDCPVCGMDLVPKTTVQTIQSQQYTCPMHADVIQNEPGSCPECGMDLVPVKATPSVEEKQYNKLLRKFWIAFAFTLPIFLIAMSEMIANNPLYDWLPQSTWNWIQFGLSIPVVFYACWFLFERAWSSIVRQNLNMFTLIGIGAGVAWLFSVFGMLFPSIFPAQFLTEQGTVHVYFEAASVILTLVLLGQLLEAKAHSKTNQSIKALLKLAPATAYKLVNGEEHKIAVNDVQKGDHLRVKPGDKLPVDGKIVEGQSNVDESMITGEPIAVQKKEGDTVSAGTINGTTSFVMVAEKVGAETLLAQIIELVNEASRSRAPIQNLADKIASYFVPAVLIISVLTFLVWAIWGPQPALVFAFVNAIAVLIIACPCALGLATPMSVMVGVGKGAENGILIKDAASLQRFSEVTTILFDKTGTITAGKPSVEELISFTNLFSVDELAQLTASVNAQSEHPLAMANVAFAKNRNLELKEAKQFQSITGKGVQATIQNKTVSIGNEDMMQEVNATIASEQLQQAKQFQAAAKTVSFIAVDEQVVGLLLIHDAIKPTSAKALEELRAAGLETILLTGDNEETAAAVAKEVGITTFQASLLPNEKQAIIQQYQQQGKVVAMTGDGINDAPALAQSDVGIAMGSGTDVAIESAGITLIKGDLQQLVKARKLSRAVMKNIRQNLFFAFAYNTLGIPIAAGLLYPFFGLLLSPMIAALAMSFSSVSVIANALRLKALQL